ncbi:RING-H2 finger protein ATL39-like [Ananas comosus]|uniref:Putative RING-H2 finger protein ATL12 n=1 Tax=Ananas comosus TaxID=4615 RepID=A0A199VN26_ANACO|nr:RING-H2 finger protein ATL39-like [Ananas comosus]OAY78423.1 putative RING-H2 finger protein ATL12 [Ananas comosus]
MLGSGLNLVTTVIGFGMSATFIVFVCARLICGRIRTADSPAAAPYDFDIEFRSDLDHPAEHAFNGLEPVVLAAIPTMKYKSDAFHSREDAQCSICLGEYEDKQVLRVMPACHHNFHLSCIDVWLEKQSTCPICRLPLNNLFDTKCAASAALRSPQTFTIPEGSGGQSNHSSRTMDDSASVVIEIPQEIRESRT